MSTMHTGRIPAELAYKKAHDPAERFESLYECLPERDPPASLAKGFLINVLRSDPDPIVRHEAAFMLGELRESNRIDETGAAPALCVAAHEDSSLVVRHESIEAMFAFEGEDVERTLDTMVEDPDDDIRLTAEITIARRQTGDFYLSLPKHPTEQHLIKVLASHSHPITRHEAAFLLGNLRDKGKIHGSEGALALCAAAREDPSLVVRHESIEALYAYDGEDVAKTLDAMADDPESDIRLTAEITIARQKMRH